MVPEHRWSALAVLNVLMNTDRYLTTYQIMSRAAIGSRKTVYNSVDILEVNGFHIDVKKVKDGNVFRNMYKYGGMFNVDWNG